MLSWETLYWLLPIPITSDWELFAIPIVNLLIPISITSFFFILEMLNMGFLLNVYFFSITVLNIWLIIVTDNSNIWTLSESVPDKV